MPERVEATPDGQVMHFAAADGPAQVVMHLRPQSPGLARYRASLNGSAALEFWTLLLPLEGTSWTRFFAVQQSMPYSSSSAASPGAAPRRRCSHSTSCCG